MFNETLCRREWSSAHHPARRGLTGLYRYNEINHCPGCGRTHWVIGRFSAECGFCATALPLAETALLGAGTYLRSSSGRNGGEWDVS